MSYILQALKRAEEDRRTEHAARGAVHTRVRARTTARSMWPWLVGAGLAVNALVIGGVILFTRTSSVVAPSPAAVERSREPAVATPSLPAEAPKTEATKIDDVQKPDESQARPLPDAPAQAATPSPEATVAQPTLPQSPPPAQSQRATPPRQTTVARPTPPQSPPPAQSQRATPPQQTVAARPAPPESPPPVPSQRATPPQQTTIAQPTPPQSPPPAQSQQATRDQTTIARPMPLESPPETAVPTPRTAPRRASPPTGATAAVAPTTVPPPDARAVEPATTEAGNQLRELASKIRVDALVWADNPRERMVFLNGRKYVEGQTVEGGAVIEQIGEDGVTLLREGQRVRVKAEAR